MNMRRFLIRRGTLRTLAVFSITTLCFLIYTNREPSEAEMQQEIVRKKEAMREQLRWDKLRQIQKTIFTNPKRPPDGSYNINVTRSEHIPLERQIPDSRPERCKSISYDVSKLPTISVVIPFYNEALSMLLRTVHSILQRTPPELLADIVIVNDNSPNPDLAEPLERYIKYMPDKVKLLRTKKREGLIRARLIGARTATGEVVMFQDAHTENNVGWAEPMLEEIRKNPTVIVQPHVEQIHQDTIEYIPTTDINFRGGFSWDLRYTWMQIPDHERARTQARDDIPFRSPTLVGCALAVNKEYFSKIGSFDDAMNIWGGENIELGFRNWMCGGQVLTHPCTRVGHVFKPFAYRFDGDQEKIVQKNLMRIAELWMDDHKKYFYAATYSWEAKHTYFTEKDQMSLAKRQQLKKELGCKGFDWYMENIIPEMPAPPMDAYWYGEVTSIKSDACWYMADDGYVGMTTNCFFHRIHPENIFYIDHDGRMFFRTAAVCVRVDPSTWMMRSGQCQPDTSQERWEVLRDGPNTGLIRALFNFRGTNYEMCLAQVTNINQVHNREQMPQLGPCDVNNVFQHWRFTYRLSFDYNFDKPLL